MISKSLLLAFFVGKFSLAAEAKSWSECNLIERDKPPHFISYDSLSENLVILRLRNNTSCSIIVETDDRFPTRIAKLPNGGWRIETVTKAEDGTKVPLHYLVRDSKRDEVPRPAYGWGNSVFTYEIPGSQSITFAVPIASFTQGWDVSVPFNYAWERQPVAGTGKGPVIHTVYFSRDELPKGISRPRRNGFTRTR